MPLVVICINLIGFLFVRVVQLGLSDASLALDRAGNIIATRMAMMAMTTSNSMSVKPCKGTLSPKRCLDQRSCFSETDLRSSYRNPELKVNFLVADHSVQPRV